MDRCSRHQRLVCFAGQDWKVVSRLREVNTFKRRPTQVEVNGRGGTEFQSVFDYIKEHRQYDGLIIFTDGYAPEPKIDFKMRTKVLWVCRSEREYKEHAEWMKKTGKVCWIEF